MILGQQREPSSAEHAGKRDQCHNDGFRNASSQRPDPRRFIVLYHWAPSYGDNASVTHRGKKTSPRVASGGLGFGCLSEELRDDDETADNSEHCGENYRDNSAIVTSNSVVSTFSTHRLPPIST